jgi:hypothetical protein
MASPFSEQTGRTCDNVRGTVQRVDLLGREVRVLVEGVPWDFAVPPTCPVVLNEERVKLRLLQPQDTVEVVFSRAGGQAVAHSVRVLLATALPIPSAGTAP